MPSTLLLLLTILTAPAVPQSTLPLLTGARAGDVSLSSAVECRLRIGPAGVPLVRVDVTPERSAWFALDTGATGTTIHPALVRRLGLEARGEVVITTVGGAMRVPTVRLHAVRIAGLPLARDLQVAVHDLRLVQQTVPEAEGILGQDVLARFDYLIDHARRRLVIGRFAPPASGVRLALAWSAGRPVLRMLEGAERSGLVLDSGSDVLVMEESAARMAVGDVPAAGRTRAVLQTHAGARTVDVEHHVGLRLANVDLPPLALVRLPSDAWRMSPEVGLLPASLFSRVYVSARSGEAVVWTK